MSNLRSVYTGAFYAVRCCASGKLGVSNFLRVSFIRNINCLVWCYQLLSSMFLAFKWFVFASNFVVKWCVYASVIVVKWCVHTSNFGGSFDLKGRRLFTVKWRLLLLDGINLLQRFFSLQNKLKCWKCWSIFSFENRIRQIPRTLNQVLDQNGCFWGNI